MHSRTITLCLLLTALFMTPAAHAQGIPVIDASNLQQNVVNTMENIAQTLKQIEEYRTQLNQYENQLQNTAAPAEYIWDRATLTMNSLRQATDTLNHYKSQAGDIDAFLAKFQDSDYYMTCFANSHCTTAMNDNRRYGSEVQKKSTDAVFRGLEKQQESMISDAETLERLQGHAQGATGQMQALGYANQLASQQTTQLLQIRALLMAQQNALVTRNQVAADREAQEAAASVQARKSRYRSSSQQNW